MKLSGIKSNITILQLQRRLYSKYTELGGKVAKIIDTVLNRRLGNVTSSYKSFTYRL